MDTHQGNQNLPVRSAGSPMASPPSAQARSVHVLDKAVVVLRHWKLAAVVAILVGAAVMYQALTTVPMYRAVARIQIEEEYTAQTDFQDPYLYYTDPEPYFQTQYRVLQGRDLALRVARRLDLQNVPEFNGEGPEAPALTRALEGVTDRLMAPFRGETPAAPVTRAEPDDVSVADALRGRVEVVPVRGSRLVDVAFVAADPEFAARAINVLAEEYVAQNLEFRLSNTDESLAWLSEEVARQEELVQMSERLLAEYREDQDALSLGEDQNIVGARLNQLNDAVARARTARIQREAIYEQVQAATDQETLSEIATNPFVQQLKVRIVDLERDLSRLLERYGERHPDVLRTRTQLTDAERQLAEEVARNVDTIRNDYETALAEERRLTADLADAEVAATDLNRKSIDYSVLEREAASNRQVYQTLLQRESELRVVANNRANNVRLLDRAQVPGAPFSPNLNRAWMLALIFGLGLGVAVAFGVDYMDDTVKTPEDISFRLRLNFLGLVPKVQGERHPLLSGPVTHAFGEAFRALRTALVAGTPGEGTRLIGVTSTQPLEGKTTSAVNLAMALALGGSRVLLIDADMRRPSLHKAMRLSNDRGLAELLAGKARMREIVQRCGDPNLLVVSAGQTPPNPSELLGSSRMKALLQQLAAGPFDWVVIDAPPVLAVTDAAIIAPMVNAMVFVVGSEMTRWRLAERAIETLRSGNPRQVHAVLNRVDFNRNRYYYSRYYGHQYKSYYAEAPAAS